MAPQAVIGAAGTMLQKMAVQRVLVGRSAHKRGYVQVTFQNAIGALISKVVTPGQ